jgi:hypothetical protein
LDKLQGDFAAIVERIDKYIGELHVRLIHCATVEEFIALRDKNFQSYLDLNVAISNVIVASNIDLVEYAYMAQESLKVTEDQFAKHAQAYLSEDTYEELRFCISTLKSATRWLPRLRSVQASDEKKDQELAGSFFINNTYVSLHLDCLKLAVQRNLPLSPEILSELMTNIRRAVMVYSHARAGLDLRNFPDSRYSEKLDVSWDAEDEALSKAD